MQETYSAQRRVAIHEAGHAVMAYLLGRAFAAISVVDDGDSYGRVQHGPLGDWFRPDIEINGRIRNRIEDEVMFSLAGAATEERWASRALNRPADWEERLLADAQHDRNRAVHFADYMCGSTEELEAYIEWQRQRVLNYTGRSETDTGQERFWCLVAALADAVQDAGVLRWRRAREVLRSADYARLSRLAREHSVFRTTALAAPEPDSVYV